MSVVIRATSVIPAMGPGTTRGDGAIWSGRRVA